MSKKHAMTRVISINNQPHICDRKKSVAESLRLFEKYEGIEVMEYRLHGHSDLYKGKTTFGEIVDAREFEMSDLPLAI